MSRGIRALIIFFAFVMIYTLARPNLQHGRTSTSVAPAGGVCAEGNLTSRWIEGPGAAGTGFAWIKLTNSFVECELPTHIAIRLVAPQDALTSFVRAPKGSMLTKQNGAPIRQNKQHVLLPRGGSAYGAVSFSDGYSCPLATELQLDWKYGNNFQHLLMTPSFLPTTCAGSSIYMSPVYR